MRKTLTVSLSLEDWQKIQGMVRSLGATYSHIFHRLVESSAATTANRKRIAKYRALLAPHAVFLAGRARVWVRASKRRLTDS